MSDPTPTPSASLVDEAAEMLGCESWFRGQTRIVCETHGDVDWPCPVAVDLAAHIEDRDQQVRADECENIATASDLTLSEMRAKKWRQPDQQWAEGCVDANEEFGRRMRERAAKHRQDRQAQERQ